MTTATPGSRESVPPDRVLSAVANKHRRAVLRELDHTDGNTMALDTLTDNVATQVRADDGGRLADDHRERVRIALHHIHLPMLEEWGMIVRDTGTRQVQNVTGELGQELLTLVDAYEDRE